jgi:hypothetical protein
MRFKLLLLSFIAIFIVSIAISPLKTSASSPGDINIAVAPQNPAPNQNTTITLSSYVDDLNSVMISWSVSGKKVSGGVGDKSLSVSAPALGKETTVIATLSLSDGDLNETIIIKPSILTLLWEANDSYVPPFYEGKAMPSPNSEVKVVALPEIKNGSSVVDPSNMTYSWQLDYTNDPNSSGYGKNYFLYTSDYLDSSNDVGVTAQTIDGNSSTSGDINIGTVNPKIDFYKNDPTLGTIWEQALSDNNSIVGNEIIQAAPYFISPQDIRIPFLTFNWSINDQQIPVPIYSKNLLPIATQAGTSGTSKIKLQINSTNNIVETATKEININF